MKKNFTRIVLIGLALTLIGCAKENWIYIQKQQPRFQQEFKVKEMKGSSAIDIVWIIDNSGSMDEYQQQVVNNANIFMKDFIQQKLNWKMGLISTDEDDLPFIGFKGNMPLDSTVVDPVGTFTNAVRRLGTIGSGEEMTFKPIIQSLQYDPNFLRPNTPVAFIMVTDAEEQSDINAQTFLSQLSTITQGRNVFAYGVFAANDFGCPSDEGRWDYQGSPYEAFINSAFVGQHYPLCIDFGTSLATIAKDIVTRVAHSAIYLTSRPKVSTIQVLYQGEPLPAGTTEAGGFWVYDYRLNAVIFNNLDFAKNDTDSVQVTFEPATH